MIRTTLIAAALLAPAAARATDYTLFVYETPAELAQRDDPKTAQGYWASYGAFAQAAAQAGVMRGGAAVALASEGAATGPTKAGPARAQLTGYFVIAAADYAEASRWAAKLPAAKTGRVEVRANLPMQGR